MTVRFATAADHAAARRWLERLAPRPVTYTDAVSFAVMDALRCTTALTFDQDFLARRLRSLDAREEVGETLRYQPMARAARRGSAPPYRMRVWRSATMAQTVPIERSGSHSTR